jgi:hypothetical protein
MNYFVISLLTIGLGAAWLLNMFPNIDNIRWVYTLGLGLIGLLLLALCGVNKLTIVTGPFLMIAAAFTILRQSGHLNVQEMPSLVIALGLLMLISVLTPIPAPGWANAHPKK